MSPPEKEKPGPTPGTGPLGKSAEATDKDQITASGRWCTSSQQVSWWSVHEHVAAILEQVGSWPMVGTPEWCALEYDDPVKSAALLDAAQHWALRLETCQQAACEASREISTAVDWSAIATETSRRREVYIPREVAS